MDIPIELASEPDLFDFQVNGFAGIDFQKVSLDVSAVRSAVTAIRSYGASQFFLTLITDSIDSLCGKLENFERIRAQDEVCRKAIVGYHLEGPWLNPADGFRGAHRSDVMVSPDILQLKRLLTASGGNIRLVTLAPEIPGCVAFIHELSRRGIHVSLGHTDATDLQIDAAIAGGARFCTHLGNGTPQMMHRHSNITQRLLSRDELTACFIPDGVHLPREVLKNFVRAKPANRVLFTTDAMAAAGARPGIYSLGNLKIEVGLDGVARIPGGEGFAGSTLTPADGVRLTATFLGQSLGDARRAWSSASRSAFGVKYER